MVCVCVYHFQPLLVVFILKGKFAACRSVRSELRSFIHLCTFSVISLDLNEKILTEIWIHCAN